MAKSKAAAKVKDVTEEPAAEWVDVTDLLPWEQNPRKNDENVLRVMESIKKFGFSAPIVARKANGEVIAGHTRLKAAQALGMTKVPVRYLDINSKDAHLLALADNRLNELAPWDLAELKDILSVYGLDDAAAAGWNSNDLERLGIDLSTPAGSAEEGASEVDVDQFEFAHVCPKCGFGFNK